MAIGGSIDIGRRGLGRIVHDEESEIEIDRSRGDRIGRERES